MVRKKLRLRPIAVGRVPPVPSKVFSLQISLKFSFPLPRQRRM